MKIYYLIFLFLLFSKISGQLRGNAITCTEPDATELDIKTISGGAIGGTKIVNCIKCTCQGGSVNCTIDECPQLKSCPLAEKPQNSSTCCPKCKTCNYLGIQRYNNERWKSVQDPCYVMSCKAGIVTSSQIKCSNHCQDAGLHIPGYCCQLCKKSIKIKNDPCLQCDSVMGIWYHCYRLACPVLDCPNNLIKHFGNKCCPECIHPNSPREYRTILPENPRLQGYCTFQLRRYQLGEIFHLDPCTRCHCQPGGIQCRRFTCPIRQCQISAKLLFRTNICCPFCQYTVTAPTIMERKNETLSNFEEFRSERIDKQISYRNESGGKITTCIHKLPNGNILIRKHNSFWKANDCLNCQCRNGKTKCERENCFPQEPFTCPKGSKKIKIAGKCCKFCEQYESTCTVSKNSQYQTFDGLNYTFHGNKSYVLTQECGFDDNNNDNEDDIIDGDEQPNFAVIAHNSQNEKDEIITRRISIIIKIQNSQRPLILQLAKNKSFTENDKPINIPINTSIYSIEDLSKYTQISIPLLGLKLKFDGQGFAELILSTMHKGKVCGLCGNYNDRENDDMWPKYADSITENIEHFGASWKFIPRKTAKTSHRCKTSKLTAEKAQDLSECRRLLDNKFFAFCRKQIHVHQYIRQCTKDVCECSSNATKIANEKPCYCHSIEAFATQCANRFIWGQWTQILQNVRQFPVHPKCDKIRRPL